MLEVRPLLDSFNLIKVISVFGAVVSLGFSLFETLFDGIIGFEFIIGFGIELRLPFNDTNLLLGGTGGGSVRGLGGTLGAILGAITCDMGTVDDFFVSMRGSTIDDSCFGGIGGGTDWVSLLNVEQVLLRGFEFGE